MTLSLMVRITIVAIASQVTILAFSFAWYGGPLLEYLVFIPSGPFVAGLLIPRVFKDLRHILNGLTFAIGFLLGYGILGESFFFHYHDSHYQPEETYNVYALHAMLLLAYVVVTLLWHRSSGRKRSAQAIPTRTAGRKKTPQATPTRTAPKKQVHLDWLSGLGIGLLGAVSILAYIVVSLWVAAQP